MENTSVRPKNTTEENWQERALRAESLLEESLQRLNYLEAQIRLLTAKRFGPSSEKRVSDAQLHLFNEAEDTAEPFSPEPEVKEVKGYQRRKRQGQRAELLEGLPENIIVHTLTDEQRQCPVHGNQRDVFQKEARRELGIIPAQFSTNVHMQEIGVCRLCEQHGDGTQSPIVAATMPQRPFPNSIASPSAIAHVIDQKYEMANPLYRQEKQWERMGVSLPRQTMSNWILTVAEEWLSLIYARFIEILLGLDILQIDETVVQVLREPGKTPESQSYMWVYHSGRAGPEITVFEYQPSRSGKHPKAFLQGLKGFIQTDGYPGYNNIPDVTRVGCLAHARRKFDEAIKASPKSSKVTKAKEGLAYCDALFRLERGWTDLTASERYQERLTHSKPVMEAFLQWLHASRPLVLPQGHTGKAIAYCLNQWDALQGFLLDGRLEISNNAAENKIRPFVLGRRNWLFSNTPRGARSSAVIYSIVETAKANGLKPYDYITHLLEQLPNIDVEDKAALEQLLPWSETLPDHCRTSK